MAIQFWCLLAITLFMTGRAVRNLLTRRFLPLADFATLSIAYYAVPLAILGFLSINPHGLAFLHPAAADPGLALMSLRFVVVALLSMEAGRVTGKLLGRPRVTVSFRLTDATHTRLLVLFAALFGLFALGVSLFGIGGFFSGYASDYDTPVATLGNAIIFFTIEALGVAMLITLLLGERGEKIPLKPMIVIAILILLLMIVVRAKRLEVVSALLPATVVLIATRPILSNPLVRMAIAGMALLGLVVVSTLRVQDGFSWFNLLYYTFNEGVYAGHSLPGIAERLETMTVSYEYGGRFLSAVFAFVPRFLWDGKDLLVYQGNLALDGVSPLGATSFLAEVVLQGGIVAVALIYGVMGFVFQRIMTFQDSWDESIRFGVMPLRFGIYIVALVIFIPHFRDGIIPAVKLSIQSFVFFLVISGFHYQSQARRSALVAASAVPR